jgi:RNAse (barnase) inhibitor barstar
MRDALVQPGPPWLLRLDGTPSDAYALAWRLEGRGIASRVLRGRKMRDEDSLFDELGAALQFPYYFGENWPALDECINDLEWIPASAFAFVIVDAHEVLDDAAPTSLDVLRRVLTKAGEEWARAVNVGEDWDRPAVPFHVLVQGEEGGLRRWGALSPYTESATEPELS